MNLSNQIWKKLFEEMLVGGQGYMVTGYRKWWNPVGWFLGRVYTKRVPPEDFWRKMP